MTAIDAPTPRGALRGTPRRTGGAGAALLTAVPEFLLAACLLVVGAVWLGWFPPYGWEGPGHAGLPALALGLPAGGLVGRLLADAVATGATERHQVADFPYRPTMVVDSIADVVPMVGQLHLPDGPEVT